MKKTISITLAGRVFEIEEDGYQKLDRYLDGLKQHFAKDGSPDELMGDIEASIAEKFSDQLSAHKQAITAQDVDSMITVMGGVNEIAGEDSSPAESTHEEGSTVKRFYRNEDDMILGGVCSGIAAYFGIDPLVIRLVFIVLGLVNGLGLLIYLVLWVIMPAAKTNSQKLEMRGKPTNVEEIQELSKEKTEQTRKPDSPIHRLLNIPVVIIGVIVKGIRAVFRVLAPAVSIAIGLCILIGSILGITATSVMGALLLFRVNSPYIVSDLPLNELASRPLYYVGVAAGCVMLFIIGMFAIILATSLIRRKNNFRMLPSAILIGMWVIAAAVGAYAATDIGPWAYTRAAQLEEQATVTKEISVTNFDAIVSNGNVRITVKQGAGYAATFKGQEQDLNALALNVKDNTLTITQRGSAKHICLFCFSHPVEGEITVPSLSSYTGSDASRAVINGFTQDLLVSLSDIARAEVTLAGQRATTTAQDASHLTLTGSASTINMRTRDIARIVADGLTAQTITLAGEDASRMTLGGTVTRVEGSLKDISRVDATELVTDRISITTHDQSRVDAENAETMTSPEESSE